MKAVRAVGTIAAFAAIFLCIGLFAAVTTAVVHKALRPQPTFLQVSAL